MSERVAEQWMMILLIILITTIFIEIKRRGPSRLAARKPPPVS